MPLKRLCQGLMAVLLVPGVAGWLATVHGADVLEMDREVSAGWRPVVGGLLEAASHGETGPEDRLVPDLDVSALARDALLRMPGASSNRATPASWSSLIRRAGTKFGEWTRRIEVGAQVLRGNTEQDFVRLAGLFQREKENVVHRVDWGGRYSQVNDRRNTNRWFINSTVDRTQLSGWILYYSGKHEYNEFQGIDYRGTGSVGVGYRFVDEEDRHIMMRVGPAVTMEIYSNSGGDSLTEDLLVEFELDWPLFERSRMETRMSMRPSVLSLDVFRFRSNTGVIVPLDNEERWSLKLGYELDYNSSINLVSNRLPMDLTTSVSVVYLRP
ncbi:MAG: hypothetical protein CMJ65_02595 [Planctomycetaceae bacterium]|nr:hypothetical protein [Planctomycetaceae bacterium]